MNESERIGEILKGVFEELERQHGKNSGGQSKPSRTS